MQFKLPSPTSHKVSYAQGCNAISGKSSIFHNVTIMRRLSGSSFIVLMRLSNCLYLAIWYPYALPIVPSSRIHSSHTRTFMSCNLRTSLDCICQIHNNSFTAVLKATNFVVRMGNSSRKSNCMICCGNL